MTKNKIYIKPSKRGTFTSAAKKRGKTVQGFASQVLANKDNYSSAMVKKANFARNAAKWKKADGGEITNPEYPLMANVLLNRNKDKDFVRRIANPNLVAPITNPNDSISTHKMASFGNYIAPTIVNRNGKLVELNPRDAINYAIKNNEYIDAKGYDFAKWMANNGYKNTTFSNIKAKGGKMKFNNMNLGNTKSRYRVRNMNENIFLLPYKSLGGDIGAGMSMAAPLANAIPAFGQIASLGLGALGSVFSAFGAKADAKNEAQKAKEEQERQYNLDAQRMQAARNYAFDPSNTTGMYAAGGGRIKRKGVGGQIGNQFLLDGASFPLGDGSQLPLNSQGGTSGFHETGQELPVYGQEGQAMVEPGEPITQSSDGTGQTAMSKREQGVTGDSLAQEYLNTIQVENTLKKAYLKAKKENSVLEMRKYQKELQEIAQIKQNIIKYQEQLAMQREQEQGMQQYPEGKEMPMSPMPRMKTGGGILPYKILSEGSPYNSLYEQDYSQNVSIPDPPDWYSREKYANSVYNNLNAPYIKQRDIFRGTYNPITSRKVQNFQIRNNYLNDPLFKAHPNEPYSKYIANQNYQKAKDYTMGLINPSYIYPNSPNSLSDINIDTSINIPNINSPVAIPYVSDELGTDPNYRIDKGKTASSVNPLAGPTQRPRKVKNPYNTSYDNPSSMVKTGERPTPEITGANGVTARSGFGNMLRSGDFQNALVSGIDNLANYIISQNRSDVPRPMLLPSSHRDIRYNENPEITSINRDINSMRDYMSRGINNPAVKNAISQRLLASGINAKGQIYGKKENIETGLRNQLFAANDQINAQNVATQNQYANMNFQNRLQKLMDKSAIVANAQEDFSDIIKTRQFRDLEREKMLYTLLGDMATTGTLDRATDPAFVNRLMAMFPQLFNKQGRLTGSLI